MEPGGLPPQGGLSVGGDEIKVRGRGALEIPATSSCYVIRGPVGGGYVRPLPPEHHHSKYHDLSDIGAVSGGGAAARRAGIMEMVGTGRPRLGGHEGGGKGSGGRGAYIRRGRGR